MKRFVNEDNCHRLIGLLGATCSIVTIFIYAWTVHVDLTGLGAGSLYNVGSSVRFIINFNGGEILGGILFPLFCFALCSVPIVSGLLLLIPLRFLSYVVTVSTGSLIAVQGYFFLALMEDGSGSAKSWIFVSFFPSGLAVGALTLMLILWFGASKLANIELTRPR